MSILGQLQRRIEMQGEEAQWAKNGKNNEKLTKEWHMCITENKQIPCILAINRNTLFEKS